MKKRLALLIFTLGTVFVVIVGWKGGTTSSYIAPVPDLKQVVLPAPELTIADFNRDELLEYTNANRSGNGLAALKHNDLLDKSAQDKCDDMVAKNYWSHATPQGTGFWFIIAKYIPKYKTAGENLAYSYDSTMDVVVGWMTSPTHKANILKSEFTQVGFGVCSSPNYTNQGKQIIIVQHFVAL